MRHIYGTLYNPVRVYCAACGEDDYFTFYRDRFADKDEKDEDLVYYEYGSTYLRKFKERVEKAIRIHKNKKNKKFWADDICLNMPQLREFYTLVVEDQLKDFLTPKQKIEIETNTQFNPTIIKDDGWYDLIWFRSKSGFIFSYSCFDKMLEGELEDIHPEFSFGWFVNELIDEYIEKGRHKKYDKFKLYWDYIFKKRKYYFDEHCAYLQKDEVIELLSALSFIIRNQKTFNTIVAELCKK